MSAKKMIQTLTQDEVNHAIGRELTFLMLERLQGEEERRGEAAARSVATALIAQLVGAVLYQTLNHRLPGKVSNAEQAQHTMKVYGEFKYGIQEAIAAAFQGAMQEYSGLDNSMEFVCQITPVKEPSKMEN